MEKEVGFFKSLGESFYYSVIYDNRYEYILEGLLNTLLISFLAVVIGVLIGIVIALIRSYHDKNVHSIKPVHLLVPYNSARQSALPNSESSHSVKQPLCSGYLRLPVNHNIPPNSAVHRNMNTSP